MFMLINDLESGEKEDFWVKKEDVLDNRSWLLKEKAEVSEQLLGDELSESRERVRLDGGECGEFICLIKDGEFLGEMSGDFKFIREGDIFFLNSMIVGELQLDTGDAIEEFVSSISSFNEQVLLNDTFDRELVLLNGSLKLP